MNFCECEICDIVLEKGQASINSIFRDVNNIPYLDPNNIIEIPSRQFCQSINGKNIIFPTHDIHSVQDEQQSGPGILEFQEKNEFSFTGIPTTLDFSINECFSLSSTSLRKYSFENRFYFVTTFLEKESIINLTRISDQNKLKVLVHFTSDRLETIKRSLQKKYAYVMCDWHYDDTDDDGNNILNYMSALSSSFQYPLSLSKEALEAFWLCAIDFHKGLDVQSIERRLIKLQTKS